MSSWGSQVEKQSPKEAQVQGFHLCQPDEHKSCGACCGLYNYQANSRGVLTERLDRRTEIFTVLCNDPDQYRQEVASLESTKLYETIYNCEFLGFVDGDHKRVGCLLHPQLNNGEDLRGISFYGMRSAANTSVPVMRSSQRQKKRRLSASWMTGISTACASLT